jgi:hypothetical protein
MIKRTLFVAALAVMLMGAGPKNTPKVYVHLLRSQESHQGENRVLNDVVSKRILEHTVYNVVNSPDRADLLLEGAVSSDTEGR